MARVSELVPVVQVGIRSLSRDERPKTNHGRVKTFFAHYIHSTPGWINRVVRPAARRSVYYHRCRRIGSLPDSGHRDTGTGGTYLAADNQPVAVRGPGTPGGSYGLWN